MAIKVNLKDGSARAGKKLRKQLDLRNACTFELLEGRTLMSASLAAPSALTAIASAPTTIKLNWKDNASAGTGYSVLRSSDGTHYALLAKIGSQTAVSYNDATALSGHSYEYEIEATSSMTTSAVSNVATVATPLGAPTGLTAQISGTSVNLNWTDNDPNATGYYVFRSQNNINFNLVATLTGTSINSFSQPFPAHGKTFYYRIQAFNTVATSAASASATVTTPLSAPTGLTAQISGTSVDLNWTDNDPNATGYYVFRSQNNINFNLVATLTGTSINSFSQPFPAHGKTFYYRIQAFNTVATSAASASATVTTPLSAPTGLTAQISGTSVDLNWTDNDPNATGYYVFRSQDNINFNLVATLTGVSINSFSQPFPAHGKTFYYRIQAFNTVATSAPSASATVTTPLSAPTGLTAQISGTSVDLNWTDNDPNATGYYVFRSQDNINFNLVATLTGASINSFSQPFPADGITFYYRIQAFNTVATSAASASATVTTPLSAPTGLTAQISGTSVDLNWTDNDPNATGYYVFRSQDNINFNLVATLTGASIDSFSQPFPAYGKTFYYRIQAFNTVATSAASASATVTTPLSAPTGLTAQISGTSVDLNWIDNDSSATGYEVLRSTDGVNFALFSTLTGGGNNSFVDSSVQSDCTYSYEVEATTNSDASYNSNIATVTTNPAAPTNLTVTTVTSSSITLAWTDSDPQITGDIILRSTDGTHFSQDAMITTAGATSFTDIGLSAHTKYYYEVEATNATATSAVSNVYAAETAMTAPLNVFAAAGGPTTVNLTWSDSDPGVSGFYILRSTDSVHFTQVGQVSGTMSFCDTSASSDTAYQYEVQAFADISSPVSATASVSTPIAAPSGLVAVAQNGAVQLNWIDNDSSATGYEVLRSTDGVNFALFSTLTGGGNNSFVDSSVQSDCTYSYEVEATTNSDASYNSNIATVTTNPAAPTNLTVTTVTSSSITLAWTDSDPQITGDIILRSTDGTHFSQDAMITTAGATSFTDIGLSAHTKYYYEVEATNATATSAVSNVYAAETAMTAPLNVFAAAGGPTTVNLTWSDSDPGVSGFYILRSTDSVHFTQVGQVSGTMSFCDTSASSDTAYQYEVQAFADISSPVSATASVSTPIAAPSGLVAVAQNGAVQLNWIDNDSSATGYEVLRSTDGTHFAPLIQLTSGSVIIYTDSTASGGVTYYYEVIATRGSTASVASNVATVTTPNSGNNGTVTLATRFSSELVITANGPDDSISVSESGSNLSIDADGTVYIDAAPADGLFIYTRGGDDTVSVDNTVNIQATVETIDGALTTISSGDAGLNAWIDSSDIFTGSGIVHRVASFAGGVTKSLGASLANPSDATHTITLNDSLFGSGPVAGDVNQGGTDDCFFLSSLAAFANSSPAVLTNSVVDMGDGTYTVQFMEGTTPSYIRVNNQFATGSYGGGLEYAHMGSSNTIWAMVMEKAFAYFRTGANTYSSISSGWMSEAYTDLGVSSTFAFPSYDTDAAFFSQVSTALSDGDAVTMGTISSPPNLVSDHAYTVISAYRDANGVAHYVVRNPWGFSGDSSENAQGYATLTFAQMQANFSAGTVATS